MMGFLLLLLLAFQVPGAAKPAQATDQDPFAALRDQWAKDLKGKFIDDCLAQYAPDADFISDEGRTHGAGGMRQLFATVMKAYDADLTFTSNRVEISGELAYDSGSYAETTVEKATRKSQQLKGDYLTVYRRTKLANGNAVWLIAEQVWTEERQATGSRQQAVAKSQ
jgi:ketosteroid isomerase-like protein